MLDNVPDELKQLKQWCCWRYEDKGGRKPTKVPYNPTTGDTASVNDEGTWTTFEVAKSYLNQYDGAGFIFSPSDPYCFIDLDDTEFLPNGEANPNKDADFERQKQILNTFSSYAELSPSNRGVHIICKGHVLAGRRRSFVEVYSGLRYATMTGNVFINKPIAECQDQIDILWASMGAAPQTLTFKGADSQIEEDQEIINQASGAANGDKFKDLLNGNWQVYYPSQSEADFAFVDIIAFYTKYKPQIERIFKNSALGQRAKAKRSDYINYMVNKSFDRMLPPIDMEGFQNALELKLAQRLNIKVDTGSSNGRTADFDSVNVGSIPTPVAIDFTPTIDVPPGLMGAIAQFIYNAAPRPVPEIAIAGAIGLMAGICGRAYNVSGTGLNQYILLLANSGRGKEAIASGIDKLMTEIKYQVPTAMGFVGPGEIASGQALLKYLNSKSQCFVSVIGEFGLRLQRMSAVNTSGAENSLKALLLDLYNKSGFGKTLKPSIYADRDKNTNEISNPCVTIVGESTPNRFYGNLSEDMIAEGLLPRFTVIEYKGGRPPLNEAHARAKPDPRILQALADLAVNCETLMHHKKIIDIQADEEADKLLKKFDKLCDFKINNGQHDVVEELWNRGHMKVLKLSALIAIGVNMYQPVITSQHVEWAIKLVESDINNMVSKFYNGEFGSTISETGQMKEMRKILKFYLTEDFNQVKSYTSQRDMHQNRVVPFEYINRKLSNVSSFRNDRIGSSNAIKRAIQVMLDNDDIREIAKNEVTIRYGCNQRAFMIRQMNILD